jgi:predicted esterase
LVIYLDHLFPPARGGQASSLIVLLHGWGADGNDLADLAYPISGSVSRGGLFRAKWAIALQDESRRARMV